MLRRDLLALAAAIGELKAQGKPLPWKISFAIAINSRRLEPLAAAAKEALEGPWDEVLTTWEKARTELVERFAKRTAEGTIITQSAPNGQAFAVMEDQSGFEEAFNLLQAGWREKLEWANGAKASVWQQINEAEADPIELQRVSPDEFAMLDGMIPVGLVEALLPMVDMPDDPPLKVSITRPVTPEAPMTPPSMLRH